MHGVKTSSKVGFASVTDIEDFGFLFHKGVEAGRAEVDERHGVSTTVHRGLTAEAAHTPPPFRNPPPGYP
jgi:hypothetical protein